MDSFHKVPPHGLFRNWLRVQFVERLLTYAQANEHLFKESEIDGGLDRSQRVSRRVDLGELKSEVIGIIQGAVPTIFKMLRVKPFIPTLEVELVAHGNGAFFARHMDTLTHHRRVVSTVYYFHTLPKAFSGGVLRLHSVAASNKQDTFVDITPDYNTLVFFPSIFPHEVLPVESPSGKFIASRFAINCWICQSRRQ